VRDVLPIMRSRALIPVDVDVMPEDEEPEPYCGPANEAPDAPFNPWRDIRPGSWVLLRAEGPAICLVWQGQAASPVYREEGDTNYGKFLIQFWELLNVRRVLASKYRNCWSAKWVKEERLPEWVSMSAVVYAKFSKIVDPKTRTIPQLVKERALVSLERASMEDPGLPFRICLPSGDLPMMS
jgi:hypothetical protein